MKEQFGLPVTNQPDTSNVMTAVDDPDRRGAMRWLSVAGMAVVGSLAGSVAAAVTAQAKGPEYCCDLSDTPDCPSCSYQCGSGYHRRTWTCWLGEELIDCLECATGATCDDGPFECSLAYNDNTC